MPSESAMPTGKGKSRSTGKGDYPICVEPTTGSASSSQSFTNQEQVSSTVEALAQPGPATGLSVAALAVIASFAFMALKLVRGRSQPAQHASTVIVPKPLQGKAATEAVEAVLVE